MAGTARTRSRIAPHAMTPRLVLGVIVTLCLAGLLASSLAAASSSSQSSLRPQTVLDAIHAAIHSGDGTQNHNCQLGGPNPLPPKPCRHDRILPTSAFLTASRGSFTTDCANPYISTFRYYEISTLGQRYRTCGPHGVWPRKAHVGEFQAALDRIGQMIQGSIGLHDQQTTVRVGGSRRAITATYQCPPVEAGTSPSGVKEIRIGRDDRATMVGCQD